MLTVLAAMLELALGDPGSHHHAQHGQDAIPS
jgi:hypothetical protein